MFLIPIFLFLIKTLDILLAHFMINSRYDDRLETDDELTFKGQ